MISILTNYAFKQVRDVAGRTTFQLAVEQFFVKTGNPEDIRIVVKTHLAFFAIDSDLTLFFVLVNTLDGIGNTNIFDFAGNTSKSVAPYDVSS